MTRINTNVPSLVAQSRLQSSNRDLQTTLTRLSTGLRINSGSDDPAGLIASEALRSEITSINKSISNTRRASQIISTADSALGQVSSLLNDIRGLVVEAANSGALSPDEIAANQLQVDSSLEAVNRIAQTTTFQGRKLLDGSLDFITANGAGASNIRNLKIDQANLGATGSVGVTINVSAAATRAAVNVAGFGTAIPGVSSTGSLTIGATSTAAAATATLTIAPLAVAATATGSITVGADTLTLTPGSAGATGNRTFDFIQDATVVSGVNATVNVTTGAVELRYNQANAITSTQVQTAINTLTGTTGITASGAVAGVAATGTVAVGADSITVTADAIGTAGNVAVTFLDAGAAGLTTAAINGTTGAIEVSYDFAAATTSVDIQAAIDGLAGFSATGAAAASSTANTALSNTALTGGTNNATSTPATLLTDSATTGGVTAAAVSTIAVTAASNGAASNVAINFINNASATGVTAGINSTTGAIEVTYNAATATSVTAIATAIDGLANFNAVATGTGSTTATTLATAGALTGGASANTASTISITSPTAGGADNVAVNFINGGSSAVGTTAAINSTTGAVEITYNFASAATADDIRTAINSLTGYTATGTTTGSTTVAGTGATGGTLTSGVADFAGGVLADVVFELAGKNGSEVFNVAAGTSLNQVIAQINLVSDATGVTAAASGTTLQLRSSDFGSEAIVDLRILTQAAGGNFGTGQRDTGDDIVASVNGRASNGVGNRLSINTATLDLQADLAEDFVGNASFTITGGGALFQLGPDVVSNQQARVGIGSVNAARLGGVAGKLFQLGSGESAALGTSPSKAADIVTEAINQVTSLRGRLGAFQATTLESNLSSLQDTVANLQEAESSIRDADFAQESAALTRAQILVQSGTNVLSLANQNPQNVLSLLR